MRQTKAQNPKRRKTIAGFLLLETTVAMYTLLLGVLTFCAMAVFANKVQQQARFRSMAYQLAKQQTESLATTSFENLSPTGVTSFPIPKDIIDSLPGQSNAKYEFAGDYQVISESTTLKTISVRIKWRNAAVPEGQLAPWSSVRLASTIVKPGSVTDGTSGASSSTGGGLISAPTPPPSALSTTTGSSSSAKVGTGGAAAMSSGPSALSTTPDSSTESADPTKTKKNKK